MSFDLSTLGVSRPDLAPGAHAAPLDLVHAQGRLQHSIATTLCVIAAARAERAAPPIHAARQHLAAIYGATRLRRRLERETSVA